jgi:hypothetical protein
MTTVGFRDVQRPIAVLTAAPAPRTMGTTDARGTMAGDKPVKTLGWAGGRRAGVVILAVAPDPPTIGTIDAGDAAASRRR